MSRELLKHALDALDRGYADAYLDMKVADSIRAELAKPEQTPVAWLFQLNTPVGQRLQISYTPRVNHESLPVYRAPVNCKYPTCHSVDYQQALATDVADQIFGKELPDWSAA